MTAGLLRVIRLVIAADSAPIRQVLFEKLRRSRGSVRAADALHQRLRSTAASGVVVAFVGLVSYLCVAPPRDRGARIHITASLPNARRRTAEIAAAIAPLRSDWVRTGLGAAATGSTLAAIRTLAKWHRLRRMMRLIRRVDRRYPFVVACRVLIAVAWYARSRQMFEAGGPSAAMVASDTNPEELAFVEAARARGIPQIFVAHVFGSRHSAQLRYSLAILDGPADLALRSQQASPTGAVVFAGGEGDWAAMDTSRLRREHPVIGIFLPNAVDWPNVVSLIESCARRFAPRQILIRRHPSAVDSPALAHVRTTGVEVVDVAGTRPVQHDARRCDWVIADVNSNVHLPILKCGVPTVAVTGLELPPGHRTDPYGFVAGGIVFHARESIETIDLDEVARLLAGAWAERFAHFDVSYLRPSRVVADEVRRAVEGLALQ